MDVHFFSPMSGLQEAQRQLHLRGRQGPPEAARAARRPRERGDPGDRRPSGAERQLWIDSTCLQGSITMPGT